MKTIDERLTEIEKHLGLMPINKREPQFEVGKWYISHNPKSKTKAMFNYNGSSMFIDGYIGYGITGSGTWTNEFWHREEESGLYVLATSSEIKEALIKEAEKRGFKEGVKFKCIDGDEWISPNRIVNNKSWEYELNSLSKRGQVCIYHNGKWAEIIEEETIKIGGYNVQFPLQFDNNPKYTIIEGNEFTKEFWQAAKLISEHSKAKIMIGCSKQFDVSLDIINQILAKL